MISCMICINQYDIDVLVSHDIALPMISDFFYVIIDNIITMMKSWHHVNDRPGMQN